MTVQVELTRSATSVELVRTSAGVELVTAPVTVELSVTGMAAPDTAAQVLAKLVTVDGPGSGLDADTVDGHHATEFVAVNDGLLDVWAAARDASATTVVDVVCVTDSIGVLGSHHGKPWPWRLGLALSAFEARSEGYGWVFAKAPGGGVPAMDSCQGTASATGAGGYSADMTVGQTAQVVATCDGVSIVWARQVGGGSIQVRDGGSGGTIVATIDTAGAAAPSRATTVDLGTFTSHTIHLTATGNVRFEGAFLHTGDQSTGRRVWTAGHSGYTTGDFNTTPAIGLDLIDTLNPALVVIATGYNDVDAATYTTDLEDLVDAVRARTSGDVAVMSPWAGNSLTVGAAKAAAAASVAAAKGCRLIDLFGAAGSVSSSVDPFDLSSDGAHPRSGASSLIAELVLREISPSESLVDVGMLERGPWDLRGTLTEDLGANGTATVKSVLGFPVIGLGEASGDANDSFSVINAKLAALLGLPGAALGLGAGGASALDTYLYRAGAGALKSNGKITGTALVASGLTGATQASRYVGATASGAPASGTFAVGDFVVAQDAQVWVCTVAGTPGTWAKASPPAASTTVSGVVELATSAETQAVTDTTRAVTPAGAASTYQPTPTFAMTTFSVNQGSWLASHPPYQGVSTVTSAAAAQRSFWVPIWLAAGTYDRIGVYVFTIGTATWRLGLDNCPMDTATPATNLLDAGTLNMAAGTGMQSIVINHTVTTSGWFYARMLVTAYTSNPSVAMHNQNNFASTPPFQGWPANDFNATRGYCGFFYYFGGTGAFAAAPAITPGNPNTGLAFSEQAPKIFLRRAS